MLNFLALPFKAIYDLNTYIKATKQSAGKTLLFLFYIFVLSSFLFFIGFLIKSPSLTPVLTELTEQIAEVIPNIEVKNGIITANNGEYYEIAPEGINQKIVFDTSRVEPVYPTQMDKEGIILFVTSKAIYVANQGQMQTFSFEKDANFTLDEQYITENQDQIISFLKKLVFSFMLIIIPIVVIILMIVLMILAIIAMAVSNLFARIFISIGDVFCICCYLLAPCLLFLFVTFILPFNIPFVWLICFVIFMVYSSLILNKMKLNDKDGE